jgi:nucleoid-associated protein YgaU
MGNEIGIKLADGSFYSVLEEDFTGRKKLVVTTSRDNQGSVQIDLYRGSEEGAETFLGSLMLENITPAPKREPEIELQLGLDSRGNLEAVASDLLSGEKKSLSLSLPAAGAEISPLEELGLEEETEVRPAATHAAIAGSSTHAAIAGSSTHAAIAGSSTHPRAEPVAETRLAGETYPVGATDRRKQPAEPRRPGVLAVIGFVLLGLVVLAGAAYLIYRLLDGGRVPRLFGGREGTPPQAVEAPAEPEPAVKAPVPQAAPAQPAAKPAEQPAQAAPAAPAQAEGVWYRIVWGDTLWDLAGTYYRNPWLYPRLAKANKIANPDLIIAGHRLFIPKK